MLEQSRTRIADRTVGGGFPVFIIGEIGINHNGSVETTKALIDCAAQAGADAVKFQKRTPELCVPRDQWGIMRDTPWGRMSYLDYRHRMEFTREHFEEIDAYCQSKGILWFASCWDEPSVDFMEYFEPPCYKAASASLTDISLLRKMKLTGRPLIMSTGMSTLDEIREAVGEARHRRPADRARDLGLSLRGQRAQPARDPQPDAHVPRVSDRLLRA